LLAKAIDLKDRGQFSEAAVLLTETVKQFPKSASAHGLLGAIYYSSLRQPKEAIPFLKRAVRLSPKSEMASLGLFHSYWNTDQQVEALEEMKRFQAVSHSQDYDEILAEIMAKGIVD